VGDFNRDGILDWFVTSIYWTENLPWGPVTGNRLWLGNGDGTFTDGTVASGVLDGGWGWGAQFCDIQNDGQQDIVHVNGWWIEDMFIPEPMALQTDTLRVFVQVTGDTCLERAVQLGIDDGDQGRGLVVFDANKDGKQDLLVSNHDKGTGGTGLTLYRNNNPNVRSWLSVRLKGRYSNSHGIGAKVTAITDGQTPQTRWIHHGCNHVSQSPPEAWFGLNGAGSTTIRVDWPSGMTSFHEVDADQFVVLEEPAFGILAPGQLHK
jgi:hypothetical protein